MSKKEQYSSAKRSQNLITTSLLFLMKEKNFNTITINDITNHADLTRRTFYAHFKTKDEVIEKYLNNIIHLYMQNFNERCYSENCSDDIEFCLELWCSDLDLIILLKEQTPLILKKAFEQFIIEMDSNFSLWDYIKLSKESKAYAPTVYANILWCIFNKWIDNGMVESIPKLSNILMSFIDF